jgi:Uma2 family endonuclease
MSAIATRGLSPPPLENGDRLDQPTFHERYEAMPRGTRAELIGGIVYMPPPISEAHSEQHPFLMTWLTLYASSTPGTKALDAPTVILGQESEPEPDAVLRKVVGTSKSVRRKVFSSYISGPPELVAEVSVSSESMDLHQKRADYENHGVGEYIALLVRAGRVVWFVREGGKFVELQPDADGILRSRIFPGLWLEPGTLLTGNMKRMQEVLNQGLATKEHAAFAAELAKQNK